MSQPVLDVRVQDDWMALELTRQDQANALSDDLVAALSDALDQASERRIRLLTLSGRGKHFCAGFDFGDIDTASDGDLLLRFVRIESVLQRLHHLPCLSIGLVQGVAVGAGADLFAACTMRIAAPGSRMRMPGWRFGLALGTRRLMERVGEAEALSMLLDSSWRTAEDALATGLVTAVRDPSEWNALIEEEHARARTLPFEAHEKLLRIAQPADTRALDMASLVESASVPGLRDRIIAYKNAAARPKPAAAS